MYSSCLTLTTNHTSPDSLYHRIYTLLWSRYCCRHGIHYSTYILQHGTSQPINGSETASCHRHDHAQTDAFPVSLFFPLKATLSSTLVQISRTCGCSSGPRRRGCNGAPSLHHPPARLDRQTSVCHHGFWQSRSNGRIRIQLETQHGGLLLLSAASCFLKFTLTSSAQRP
jgi:hypothetical protein